MEGFCQGGAVIRKSRVVYVWWQSVLTVLEWCFREWIVYLFVYKGHTFVDGVLKYGYVGRINAMCGGWWVL